MAHGTQAAAQATTQAAAQPAPQATGETAAQPANLPDLTKTGTLTVEFREGDTGEAFSFGSKVGLFKVAELALDENGLRFVYDELFESVGDPPTLASELNDTLADRLEEVAEYKGISLEVPSEEIGGNGKVRFENITPGLYLAVQTHRGTDSPRYRIEPFLVTMPIQVRNVNNDRTFVYDVEMVYNSDEKGHGTARLVLPRSSMVDTTSVPVVKKEDRSWVPKLLLCLAAGMVVGIAISRMRKK